MAKTKTGIFSGSFNPIHIGHLALANYLCEFEGLDEVWFMVTPHNPFKKQADLWSDELRLQLVQLAIEGYPRFRASDFEFHLPRPSYTIHTLNRLKQEYPEREFQLIIGSDNWMVFDRWFESERIVSENKILVYPRPGFPVDASQLPPNVHLAHSPIFEISSTFIRQALAAGKDATGLCQQVIETAGRTTRKDNLPFGFGGSRFNSPNDIEPHTTLQST